MAAAAAVRPSPPLPLEEIALQEMAADSHSFLLFRDTRSHQLCVCVCTHTHAHRAE